MLRYILGGCRAEILKLKRSLALIAALLIPLFPAFVNFASTLRSGVGRPIEGMEDLTPWSLYFVYANKFWTIFALPFVVAILSALLANLDHKSKTWKTILALSYPRGAVFASKWVALAGITLLSSLTFALSNLLGGVILHFVRPELGLDFPAPVMEMISNLCVGWLLSMFMISIHHWISLRWSSFLASVVVGFAASVSNIFLISSYLYEKAALSPWAMPVMVYEDYSLTLIISLIGAALVYLFARIEFVRRDVL
jgi:hypothetical protein